MNIKINGIDNELLTLFKKGDSTYLIYSDGKEENVQGQEVKVINTVKAEGNLISAINKDEWSSVIVPALQAFKTNSNMEDITFLNPLTEYILSGSTYPSYAKQESYMMIKNAYANAVKIDDNKNVENISEQNASILDVPYIEPSVEEKVSDNISPLVENESVQADPVIKTFDNPFLNTTPVENSTIQPEVEPNNIVNNPVQSEAPAIKSVGATTVEDAKKGIEEARNIAIQSINYYADEAIKTITSREQLVEEGNNILTQNVMEAKEGQNTLVA